MGEPTTIEVFADVACPFTHVGLRRVVERRHELGHDDVVLRVRAWPLEIVNARPLDAAFIGEEVAEIREQVAPDLFAGFSVERFPATSLPALALAAAAYRRDLVTGERVSLALRDLLFEQGRDIADPDLLAAVAAEHSVAVEPVDEETVRADHAEGVRRGVVGSPFFVTSAGGFFCPSLDVSRDAQGHLRITAEPAELDRLLAACFA